MPLKLILNIVLFQLGWFACITLNSYWAVVITLLILCIHFIYICGFFSAGRIHYRLVGLISEAVLLCKVLCVGVVIELTYLWFDILIRHDNAIYPPLWLLCIWLLFATTMRHSLLWLRDRFYLSVLFAAVAAPGSYYAGVQLNDMMSLGASTVSSLLFISVSWAIVFPLMMRFGVVDLKV